MQIDNKLTFALFCLHLTSWESGINLPHCCNMVVSVDNISKKLKLYIYISILMIFEKCKENYQTMEGQLES